jgi:effector-binding domain-containing protein/DNA-binding transcriptional MerR regulator
LDTLYLTEKRGEENNYRYYAEKQLVQILIIKELKKLGFSLKDIKLFMKNKQPALLENKLESKLQEIEEDIVNLNTQRTVVLNSIKKIRNGMSILKNREKKFHKSSVVFNINLKAIPSYNVIFTRYKSVCSATELFFERYVELQAIRDEYNFFSNGPLIAIYHEHYTSQFFSYNKKLDLELCLPIIGENNSCLHVKKIGGFLGATILHIGDYFKMFSAYLALVDWINNNDYKIIGPALEEYIIDPTNTERPDDYVTRITFPIQKHI